MDPEPAAVTTLLLDWRQGNRAAGEQLLTVIYDGLHRLAAHYLQGERADHTLQPTALVHELYLRLFAAAPVAAEDRAHLFALAARTLRHILVDHARRHRADKRGGAQFKVTLTAAEGWAEAPDEDLLALDEALERLAQLAPQAAQVVELRFFSGLSEPEVAAVLGVPLITVKRDWQFARAWLLSQLRPS